MLCVLGSLNRTKYMGADNIIPFPAGRPYADLSDLEKERARVQILVSYLDQSDPGWRQKIKDLTEDGQ